MLTATPPAIALAPAPAATLEAPSGDIPADGCLRLSSSFFLETSCGGGGIGCAGIPFNDFLAVFADAVIAFFADEAIAFSLGVRMAEQRLASCPRARRRQRARVEALK